MDQQCPTVGRQPQHFCQFDKRQTEMSATSSIREDIDKTQTNMMLSPTQRTSESTQLGSPKMSPASPRNPTTRISTLTVNAKENQLTVEKTPFVDAVLSSPCGAAHATWPESSEIKQFEDSQSSASIMSPVTSANPTVLVFKTPRLLVVELAPT